MDELSYMQHFVAEQVAGDFIDEIEKLQQENKHLREALEFYADIRTCMKQPSQHSFMCINPSSISIDDGEIAREILNKR